MTAYVKDIKKLKMKEKFNEIIIEFDIFDTILSTTTTTINNNLHKKYETLWENIFKMDISFSTNYSIVIICQSGTTGQMGFDESHANDRASCRFFQTIYRRYCF